MQPSFPRSPWRAPRANALCSIGNRMGRISVRARSSNVTKDESRSAAAKIGSSAKEKAVEGGNNGQADSGTIELQIECIHSISQVSSEEWNACAKSSMDYTPFVCWEFLNALEESESVMGRKGWLPQHLLVKGPDGKLLGCCPLYLKGHSYGEYVFDHQWAEVSHYMGERYYPKLQSCVPFTPVTGSRMLVKEDAMSEKIMYAMAEGLRSVTDSIGVSSLHMTFNTETENDILEEKGFISRMGMQYHWQNKGYQTFNDFLLDLRQSKRKTIKQERKCLEKEGLRVQRLQGEDIKPAHWDNFYMFYRDTCDRKWGEDYLTRDFFHNMGEALGDNVLLFMATDSTGDSMAGALNLMGTNKLFGRVWGKRPGTNFKHLHFELSYYQALDVAIEQGISTVEAGAQGQHKIQRGYLPSPTFSSHYVRNPKLKGLVTQAMQQEQDKVMATIKYLHENESPYKL